MLNWIKVVFFNYCPKCLEKKSMIITVGMDYWEEYKCLKCEKDDYFQ